jgi:hypothetical protein
VEDPLVAAVYAYELRLADEICSTGRLTAEYELATGDELSVAGLMARVEELTWADGELRLLLAPVAPYP